MTDTIQPDPDAFEDPLSNYDPAEYPSELHRIVAEEPVSSIQTQPFVQLTSDATVGEAIQSLHDTQVSSLLVMEDNKLVGIFTERDMLENVAEQLPEAAATPVRELMTSDPLVVYETDPVGAAVAAIAIAGHRHVPVLKMDGTVLGIVSPHRVLRYLQSQIEAQ